MKSHILFAFFVFLFFKNPLCSAAEVLTEEIVRTELARHQHPFMSRVSLRIDVVLDPSEYPLFPGGRVTLKGVQETRDGAWEELKRYRNPRQFLRNRERELRRQLRRTPIEPPCRRRGIRDALTATRRAIHGVTGHIKRGEREVTALDAIIERYAGVFKRETMRHEAFLQFVEEQDPTFHTRLVKEWKPGRVYRVLEQLMARGEG